MFDIFKGIAQDSTKIVTQKGIVFVVQMSDINNNGFPCHVGSGGAYFVGSFENNTVKFIFDTSKTIQDHTGSDIPMSYGYEISGNAITRVDLDQIQELIDNPVCIIIADVPSLYSDSNFSQSSPTIPDLNYPLIAKTIIYNATVNISEKSTSGDITKVEISSKDEDIGKNIDLRRKIYTSYGDIYFYIGDDSWFLASNRLIDNSAVNYDTLRRLVSVTRQGYYFTWGVVTNNKHLYDPFAGGDDSLLANTTANFNSAGYYTITNTLILSDDSSGSGEDVFGSNRYLYAWIDMSVPNFATNGGMVISKTGGLLSWDIDISDELTIDMNISAGNGGSVTLASTELTSLNNKRVRHFFMWDYDNNIFYYANDANKILYSSDGTNNTPTTKDDDGGLLTVASSSTQSIKVYGFGVGSF